jgi:DNA primase
VNLYDIDQIKQRNPIEEIISRYGIVLLRSGARMAGRCPFHNDQNPSLVVYPETRSFYCFGCGASGDVIDFVRRFDGLGFRAALERLNDGASPESGTTHDRLPNRDQAPKQPRTLSLDDRMILTAASAVYSDLLWRTPAALAYLEGRGIGEAVIRRCHLGYCDGHSLSQYLQRRRLSLRRAREMGLLWRDGGERMAGRVVVPEMRGDQCVWMVGRPLDDAHDPKYRGLSLPKPLLGYERVRGRQRVFVTEGTFDYLTGVGWSLSICALQGIKVQAQRLAFLERARRIFLVFDNDERGREAVVFLTGLLGDRVRVIELPPGVKDLNDLGQLPDGRATFFELVRMAESQQPKEEVRHAVPAR